MSKNASSDFDESQKPDNPQEMLNGNFTNTSTAPQRLHAEIS